MKYNVNFSVTLNGSIQISAKTKKEALEKAGDMRNSILKNIPTVNIAGTGFKATDIAVKSAEKVSLLNDNNVCLTVYTDGGYHLYKNEGAYAFVILDGEKEVKRFSKKVVRESNNRCELHAIIEAVRECPANADLTIRSDSQYAINTLEGKWNRNTNLDLFKQWDEVLKEKTPKITFEWVRGHNGNKYNELCDQLCDEAVGYDLNAWTQKFKKK